MSDTGRAYELYLDLLEHCLAGAVDRQDLIPVPPLGPRHKRLVVGFLRRRGLSSSHSGGRSTRTSAGRRGLRPG
ncbi:MAG TPA: hypothetical protein VGM80_07665 [Gaiellaceae bacterium]